MSIHFDTLPKYKWHRRTLATHLNLLRKDKYMKDKTMKKHWLIYCRGMVQAFWFAERPPLLTGEKK